MSSMFISISDLCLQDTSDHKEMSLTYPENIEMTKKLTERCSTSSYIREMQIKSIIRYHLT